MYFSQKTYELNATMGLPLIYSVVYLLFFSLLICLGIKLRASGMLGKHSTTELHLLSFGTLSKSEKCHIAIKS